MKINWNDYVQNQLQWAHCLTKLASDCNTIDKSVLQAHIRRAYRNVAEARGAN